MPSDAPFDGSGFDEGVRCSRNDDGRALSQRLFSARARHNGLRTGAGPGGRQHRGPRAVASSVAGEVASRIDMTLGTST